MNSTTTLRDRIYLSPPHMCGVELDLIKDAYHSNWIAPLGPYVDRFENTIQQYLGGRHCAALSSGTAALHLALKILKVEQDDFVICPSFTFSASANPILYEKAIPVFVDSEMESWNMDPHLLEDAIQFCLAKNKKPKAIIVVHLYGMPAKIDEIMSIAGQHNIPLIEDAAESLGSKYKGKLTGNFGALSVLSFNGNKIITTSGGGALLSDSEEEVVKAKFYATQSREKAIHYEHREIGYNYRLSNICAAIGCGQMTVIEERVERRRSIFKIYNDILSTYPGLQFNPEPQGCRSNRWLTTMIVQPSLAGFTHLDILNALEKENIEARPLWKPLHLQPVFSSYPSFVNGNSESLFSKGICLPSGTALTDDQIQMICSLIRSLN